MSKLSLPSLLSFSFKSDFLSFTYSASLLLASSICLSYAFADSLYILKNGFNLACCAGFNVFHKAVSPAIPLSQAIKHSDFILVISGKTDAAVDDNRLTA